MDTIRQKIANLTHKLQGQTQIPLWALANENVIYAIATKNESPWGPKTMILFYIMRIAYRLKMADFIIFIVGLYRAIRMWCKVKKDAFSIQKSNKFTRVFAGFGAAAEEHLYRNYMRQESMPSLRICWVSQKGMSELGCPSLASIVLLVLRNSIRYSAKLKNAVHEVATNPIDFLTIAALNIGRYSFYRSYWCMAKKQGVGEVTFLAPDVPAIACIDEGIKSIFMQHGLLNLSIVFPKFNRIDALTTDEQHYLNAALKNAPVLKKNMQIKNKNIRNNIVMVLSFNIFAEVYLISLESFMQWAKKMELQIVLRPTPNADKTKLDGLCKRFHDHQMDDVNVSFDDSLVKWQPKFVVGCGSTGLATALEQEYLPISLWDPHGNDASLKMIYPLHKRVLFWPRDESLLERVIESEDTYYSQVKHLHEGGLKTLPFRVVVSQEGISENEVPYN